MALNRSIAQIGAPQAWREGYAGQGVKLAVLDSGVDETHPSLAGREIVTRNFTEDGAADVKGHGTHLASTIDSHGDMYRCAAPGVSILDGKVLGDDDGGRTSWILDGMEWALAQGPDIVNMSLDRSDTEAVVDPIEEAVNRLSEQGCCSSSPRATFPDWERWAVVPPRRLRRRWEPSTATIGSATSPARGLAPATTSSSRTSPHRAWR